MQLCPDTPRPLAASLAALTPRQAEVLERVGRGMRSGDIAAELGLSPRTVEMHRACVLRELGFDSTVALLVALVPYGLGARCRCRRCSP